MDFEESKLWNVSDIFWITVGIGVFFLAGALVLFGASKLFNDEAVSAVQPTMLSSVYLASLEGFSLIGSVYFFGIRRKKISWDLIFGGRPNLLWLWLAPVIAIAAIPISAGLSASIRLLLGRPMESPQLSFLVAGEFSWLGFIGMLLSVGVIVPIGEELFFRGVLYRWIHQRWNVIASAGASGLLFGILHGEISIMISAALLGFILALIFEKSKSLWSPIMVHVLINSLNIIVLYTLLALGFEL